MRKEEYFTLFDLTILRVQYIHLYLYIHTVLEEDPFTRFIACATRSGPHISRLLGSKFHLDKFMI